MHHVREFFWDECCLFRVYVDGMIQIYVPEIEIMSILEACHSSLVGGHHSGVQIVHRILKF